MEAFINRALRKMQTWRMLVRINWYIEIADGMAKIRPGRPALQLIFLMALAERMYKKRTKQPNARSLVSILGFFDLITPQDKKILERGMRRSLSPVASTPKLRFSSILRILYDVRNQAVHGYEFWGFSLMDAGKKRQHAHYTHYSMLSSGTLVAKRSRKRKRVSLDISITYEELRDVFIRTALENIKAAF